MSKSSRGKSVVSGKGGAQSALEKQVLANVEKALQSLQRRADALRKSRHREKYTFHVSFVEQMTTLLRSAKSFPNMTTAELASLHERAGAFIHGLRTGMVAMQGDLPPTDTSGDDWWSGLQQCTDSCFQKYELCLKRAEEAALKTAGRRGVLIGFGELVARQLACLAAYALCVDNCQTLNPPPV